MARSPTTHTIAEHFGGREPPVRATYANRWHLQIRLEAPDEVDRQLIAWIEAAYALAK